jgi:hypothetical protein
MKTYSAQEKTNVSASQKAHGCLTANLAVPGLGSLIGGRKVGLAQMVIYFSGFALTLIFGLRFIYWALTHWSEFYSEFYGPNANPVLALPDVWQRTRWALLGILLFAIAWSWALLTSWTLISEAKQKKTITVPDEKN